MIRSSYGLDFFAKKKEKKEPVPAFREEAALELFIKSLDEVVRILRFCNMIDKPFDTATMLARFRIPDWEKIRPLKYYLTLLQNKYNEFRNVLKKMYELGRTRWYYELSKNIEFLEALNAMIALDEKCEIIIGNELKQDQLKFMYDSMRSIYDSPLKQKLLTAKEKDKDKDEEKGGPEEKPSEEDKGEDKPVPEEKIIIPPCYLIAEVLPKLVAFRSLVAMHLIDVKKKKDQEEEEKRLKALPPPEKKEEEKKEDENPEEEAPAEEPPELTPEEQEALEKEKEEQRKEAERQHQMEEDKKYGRYMIWEGFIAEPRYPEWKTASAKVDGLNAHVIEDIQDYIILQTYQLPNEEGKKEFEKAKKAEEERKIEIEKGDKEEDKVQIKVEAKLEEYRPHKRVWNYFLEKESPYLRPHRFRFIIRFIKN